MSAHHRVESPLTISEMRSHKNIQHTARYTELAADRFKSFWEDKTWIGARGGRA